MSLRLSLVPLLLAAALGARAQETQTPPSTPPVVNSPMDGEMFYQLMLGEMSAQGGDPGVGYSLILDAARKTGDERLYRRAVDIALEARSGQSALDAARAWKKAHPASREANRFVLQILIGLNKLDEVVGPIEKEVALSAPSERALTIAMLPRYFARNGDKEKAAKVLEKALSRQLKDKATGAVAWSAVGRLRFDARDMAGALDAARRGQAIDAGSEAPVLLALALISSKTPQAEAIVLKYLDGRKPMPEVRLAYARALLDAQRYAEAAEQTQIVTRDKPDFAEAWLIRGTLELQDNRLDDAERSLLHFLDLTGKMQDPRGHEAVERAQAQAYLSLAQIAEQRKNFDQAEQWLNKITSTDVLLRVQSRRADILARQGKIDEARQLIRSIPERSPADARLKLSTEVQLLRDNKLYQQAYDLLAEATRNNPKDYDLLYDQATLAEKLGKPQEMESILRRIIAEKPDYHHAYNALGYFLADHNERLPEARRLIVKALEFAPGDPFIMDSLGWLEFRSGNKTEALRILQQAYRARPDPEIAAHLGEVLWSLGQQDAARGIWREGLQLNPDNEALLDTLKRLNVKL